MSKITQANTKARSDRQDISCGLSPVVVNHAVARGILSRHQKWG